MGSTRKCLSRATSDGHPCQQDVHVSKECCESGHVCATPASSLPPATERLQARASTLEIDELASHVSSGARELQLFAEPGVAKSKPKGKKHKPFVPPRRSAAARREISSRLAPEVITLDMDGTAYDPWACCQRRDSSWTGTAKCRHVRSDTIDAVSAIAASTGASLVVLSWRGGGDSSTRQWLRHIGLNVAAVFVPGGADDICGYAGDHSDGFGQIGFKVATVKALRALGHNVIASFDDRASVCKALESIGVPAVHLVPHLANPLPHEYAAGYIGAPKPDPKPRESGSAASTTSGGWWERGGGSLIDRHRGFYGTGWEDPIGDSDDLFGGSGGHGSLRRLKEALGGYDPFDPSFDPDELIEMADLLGDPDAPPVRLHEIVDPGDQFFLADTDGPRPGVGRGGNNSRRRRRGGQ